MIAALMIGAALAFSGAITGPLLFDDVASIDHNLTIRQLWPPSVALHPPPGEAVSGRPVVNYSFAANYAINERLGIDQRPDPEGPRKTVGYHVINILLHLGCGLLLLGIVRRTLMSERLPESWRAHADAIALTVAALWLLDPIQTEAVDYLVQRTELLASLCYLGTLYASIRAWSATTRASRTMWYAAGVLICLIGMGSKEIMISAPIAVVLYDVAFVADSARDLRRDGRPWFYIALAATSLWLIASIAVGARRDTVGFGLGITWYEYLYTQAWAIPHYVRLALWPRGLSFDYGQSPIHGPGGALGGALLIALGVATVVAWRRARWLGFLGTLFFMILAPSSSIVPIRTEIAAERRIYLALAPVIVVLVVGLELMRRRLLRTRPAVAAVAPVAVIAIPLLFAGTSFARSRLYTNPEALWRGAVGARPDNPRAYDNLAAIVIRQPGRTAEAESLYRRAIAIDSTYMPAWSNLAQVLNDTQRFPEEKQVLERAMAINPEYVDAARRLGGLLVRLGDMAAAVPLLERVAASHPTDDVLVTLASAYGALGRPDDAMSALQRALSLNPRRDDVASYVGAQLAQSGRVAEAVPYLERGARLDSSAMTLGVLSLAYAQLGRADDADAAATAVLAREPSNVDALLLGGRAMLLAGRAQSAERLFAQAARANPRSTEALTRLGFAQAALGDPAKARESFQRALAIDRHYEPARRALERVERPPAR